MAPAGYATAPCVSKNRVHGICRAPMLTTEALVALGICLPLLAPVLPACWEREAPYPAHSMISFARTNTMRGTARPRSRAVFRLTAISYLSGACTGRSAGLAPLRMRST